MYGELQTGLDSAAFDVSFNALWVVSGTILRVIRPHQQHYSTEGQWSTRSRANTTTLSSTKRNVKNVTMVNSRLAVGFVVIPVVLVFLEFLVSAKRQSENGRVGIFAPKMEVLSPHFLEGPIFMGYHH